MGISRAAAAAVLAVSMLACSGGSPKATGSTVAPTVANTSSAPALDEKARAQAIVLTDTDFPSGWQGSAHTEDPGDKVFERRVEACAGVAAGATTTDVFGDDFNLNQASVGSEVQFFKTLALARADIATVNNSRIFTCVRSVLVDELKAALAKQGVKGAAVSGVSLVRTTIPRYADQSAGVRLTATVTVSGQAVHFFQDIFVARKGRAEATASFFNIGAALPSTFERSLFAKLAARLVTDGGA